MGPFLGVCPVAANWPNTNYQAAVLAFGPWAYWKLNEPAGNTTVADSSGHGRTMNRQSANPTLGASGLIRTNTDTCCYIPFASISTADGWATASPQTWTPAVATIEVWLNTPVHSSNQMSICSLGDYASSTRGLSVILDASGQPIFQYLDASNVLQTLNFAVGFSDNATHQMCFVLDGSHVTCYKDGAQAAQLAQPTALKAPMTRTAFIGQPTGGTGVRAPQGFFGPVAFYDQVLTGAEINALFQAATTLPS